MGFGNITKGQVIKGLLFLISEAAYICYMVFFAWQYLSKFLTLGSNATSSYVDEFGIERTAFGDNSMLILLYGILSILITGLFIGLYITSVKSAVKVQRVVESGKKPDSIGTEIKSILTTVFMQQCLHCQQFWFPALQYYH